jgi:hypothetical protein
LCVGADTDGRNRLNGFQPGDKLVLTLQTYKNERGRLEGDGADVAGRAKGAATAVIM